MLAVAQVIRSSRKRTSVEHWIEFARQYGRGYTHAMKTAISLPDSLFHAADSLARRTGMSRSELFRAAVADYIEAHRHDQVREALDAVYSEQPSQLDAELMRMQTMSLPKEDW